MAEGAPWEEKARSRCFQVHKHAVEAMNKQLELGYSQCRVIDSVCLLGPVKRCILWIGDGELTYQAEPSRACLT